MYVSISSLYLTGMLFFDFRYMGRRCREITALNDTLCNRKKLEADLSKTEKEIVLDQFDYAAFCPYSGRSFSSCRASRHFG